MEKMRSLSRFCCYLCVSPVRREGTRQRNNVSHARAPRRPYKLTIGRSFAEPAVLLIEYDIPLGMEIRENIIGQDRDGDDVRPTA